MTRRMWFAFWLLAALLALRFGWLLVLEWLN